MPSILLVEDHPDMRSLLSDLLELGGYQVLTGRTGNEGLQALKAAESLPEAVISDLNMPQMDGLSLFDAIRTNPAWNPIRLILMSADPHDERLLTAEQHGVDALIPKPFSIQQLQDILQD